MVGHMLIHVVSAVYAQKGDQAGHVTIELLCLYMMMSRLPQARA